MEREVVGADRHEAFHAMLDRSAAVYLGRRVVASAQKAPTRMSRGLLCWWAILDEHGT